MRQVSVAVHLDLSDAWRDASKAEIEDAVRQMLRLWDGVTAADVEYIDRVDLDGPLPLPAELVEPPKPPRRWLGPDELQPGWGPRERWEAGQ